MRCVCVCVRGGCVVDGGVEVVCTVLARFKRPENVGFVCVASAVSALDCCAGICSVHGRLTPVASLAEKLPDVCIGDKGVCPISPAEGIIACELSAFVFNLLRVAV